MANEAEPHEKGIEVRDAKSEDQYLRLNVCAPTWRISMKKHVRMVVLATGLLMLGATALAQQVAQNHVHEECRQAESFQSPCKCSKQTRSLTCTNWRTTLSNKVCNKTCPVCACTPDGWVAGSIFGIRGNYASTTLRDYLTADSSSD